MMKKVFVKIAALVLSIIFLSVFSVCVFADTYPAGVYDEADVLTSSQEQTLESKLINLCAEFSVNVAVVTVDSIGYKSAESFADDYYDTIFPLNSNGILLLIVVDDREWAVSTSGRCIDVFGWRQLDKLENEVVSCLRYDEYAEACEAFAYVCKDVFEDRGYMLDDDYTEPFPVGMYVVIALIVGIIVGFIVVSIMRAKLKTVYKHTEAGEYVVPGSFNLTVRRDIYLYRTVSRVRKQNSSNSSGSGSHTSSSGASHGGRSGRF